MLTSQGFHTFTISKPLAVKHAEGLLDDFKRRKRKAGEVRIRPDRLKNKVDPFGHHWIIEYPNQSKGLTWNMRICRSMNSDKPCNIKATINPKVLVGIQDYIAAANSHYLESVEAVFNDEARKISPYHLGRFGDYSLIRNDYCLNIDLNELKLPCEPEDMIALIKRGDIPPHYNEWTEKDAIAHRDVPGKSSFYLTSKSVVINYYWKYAQLLDEWPDCPDLEASRNIIRFEIQFRYPKMYSLSKIVRAKTGFSNSRLLYEMLSEDFCADVIRSYFNRVIGKGDYFTLDGARRLVELRRFKPSKEQRLLIDLKYINESRGIHKAKAALQDKERDDFNRSLRDLEEVGINPVTIPKEWGVELQTRR